MTEESISTPGRVRTVSNAGTGSPKRKSTSLPGETVEYLKAWMMSPEHIAHPYPTEAEKATIMADTGIEMKQLTNWFVNNRKRFWKPRVEARLKESQEILKRDGSVLSLVDVSNSRASLMESSLSPRRSSSKRKTAKRAITVIEEDSRHIISEQNSVASVDSEDDASIDDTHKIESINVHILRPTEGDVPSLADVSVLPNVPSDRVLQTYENCAIASFSDEEVLRIKKHYLAVYVSNTRRPTVVKRKAEQTSVSSPPRAKFHRVSIDLWKESCQNSSFYDHERLPSLEEAAQLFGYAS